MTQKVSRFKVGAFVLLGLLLALGAIVWLGAMQYLQGGSTYVTFFSESVQGLKKDSLVKYRGVDVGRVEQIRVAPDYKLIEVVMQVDFEGEPEKEMVAELRSVGITGIVFVELDLKKPNEPDLSPEITFAAEYPIIPSKPSELTQIISMLSKTAEQIQQIDFAGMGKKFDSILTVAEEIVKDKRFQTTLENISQATANLVRITARADQMLTEMNLPQVRREAEEVLKLSRKAIQEAYDLLAEAKSEIKKADLPGTAGQAKRFVARLGGQSDAVMGDIQEAVAGLRQAAQTLDGLLRRLRQSPSYVLFSKPPPPREDVDHE